ncbi:MAG: DUF1997 domain-containing protein [Spirulinaceae cyanobacterium]
MLSNTKFPILKNNSQLQEQQETVEKEPINFSSYFQGSMEMYSDPQTVASYLDAHEDWFSHCAQPMTVEPLGENSYILIVGRFGSFGYEVEPKIAVELLPPEKGIYHMKRVPVPDYSCPEYDVDYNAAMQLQAIDSKDVEEDFSSVDSSENFQLPKIVTRINWNLSLGVAIKFPQFIYKLPQSLIQKTGDRVLTEIVRQVSRRLTYKVQQDFHSRFKLPMPGNQSRKLEQQLFNEQK